ncbi:MAG: hypothetical protein NTX72_01265 [Candidatus Uhrbacteria bacterium]|nr:hypothetical protein [Candidatus Uhrbacteria bacterium]
MKVLTVFRGSLWSDVYRCSACRSTMRVDLKDLEPFWTSPAYGPLDCDSTLHLYFYCGQCQKKNKIAITEKLKTLFPEPSSY